MQFKLEVIIIGAAYFGYFVAAIVALALLAQDEVPAGVIEYAHQVVFVTSALHFGFMLYGFTQPDYVVHPVGPKWLFLYSDYVMATALGGTIAAYILDHDNLTPIVIGNATVASTQMLCAWKSYKLISDVRANRRDPETGALLA